MGEREEDADDEGRRLDELIHLIHITHHSDRLIFGSVKHLMLNYLYTLLKLDPFCFQPQTSVYSYLNALVIAFDQVH